MRVAAVVLTAALVAAVPVVAQPLPPGGPDGFPGAPPRPEMCERITQHESQRRAEIEKKLNLSATQRPAWEKFTATMSDAVAKDKAACLAAASAGRPKTVLDAQDRMRERLQQHLARIDATRPALAEFYAQLTPEQRQVIDTPPERPRHRRDHGDKPQRG